MTSVSFDLSLSRSISASLFLTVSLDLSRSIKTSLTDDSPPSWPAAERKWATTVVYRGSLSKMPEAEIDLSDSSCPTAVYRGGLSSSSCHYADYVVYREGPSDSSFHYAGFRKSDPPSKFYRSETWSIGVQYCEMCRWTLIESDQVISIYHRV